MKMTVDLYTFTWSVFAYLFLLIEYHSRQTQSQVKSSSSKRAWVKLRIHK